MGLFLTRMIPFLSGLRAFISRIFHRFVEENFGQISASLAYTTLLSLVPLVAVVLGIISVLPFFPGMVDQLNQFVIRSLLPERSAGMIIEYILGFSQKAANVTLVGLSVLVTTVFLLLKTVERAFNHVWRVSENRPWWRQMRLYAAVLILWPLVVAGVVTATSYAVTISLGLMDELPWMRGLLFKLTGLSVAALFFAGFYFAVPNTRVVPKDALWAGLFAALGFLLMQKTFEFYLSHFPSYTLVYGAFATIPIFLLWLYLSWAVVLLGALIAATLPEFRQHGSP
jgi:membrane protein